MNKKAAAAFIFTGVAIAGAAVHGARGDVWEAYWAAAAGWFAFNYARETLKCSKN